ncbi:DsbA family protein [Terriglobus roseus]|uniref:Protein-disulfide isomerase n=1 Tax=Terriglobus roseus TaxID=392734 RepID=A0A1H4QPX5_9BACT|nr:thioredoxin domain-containing protein [Terriglobus roseus]SEC21665.1 Protein-disulfide isomerase [Terriglobus roseus]
MTKKLSLPVSEDDHAQGNARAAVTLVEYGDYQCPTCGAAYPIVKQLQKHFGDRLRFVHRNFPLDQHRYAEPAAETAEFAASEGKFWEMHDALYENQDSMDEDLFPELATELDLDPQKLEEALDGSNFTAIIDRDLASGEASGVRGTPTFFLNGIRHDDAFDYETLKAAITAATEK